MSSYSRQQLEMWLKTLRVENATILDVGGSQLPITGRLGYEKGNSLMTLDLSTPHELKKKPDIIADLNDEYFGNGKYAEWEEHFDVGFCLEVSEYWWNPYQALKNICSLLKPGAPFYISFHFIYPVHNPQQQDYLRYTEFGATELLKKAGFDTLDIKWRTAEVSSPMALYQAEKMKPSKDYLGHDALGFLITAVKR